VTASELDKLAGVRSLGHGSGVPSEVPQLAMVGSVAGTTGLKTADQPVVRMRSNMF